jgi:carbon-monoxide dehydrogenase large subunit
VVNAVVDALNSGGHRVRHIDMPLTSARVWAAMEGGAATADTAVGNAMGQGAGTDPMMDRSYGSNM